MEKQAAMQLFGEKLIEEANDQISSETDGRKLILHVITRLDFGGSSQQVLLLADKIRESGFESIIIAGKTENPHSDLEKFRRRTGIQIIIVDELRRNPDPLRDCIALFKLHHLFRTLKPDLIHTNCSKAGVLGRMASITAGRTPVVHTPHGHLFYGYYNSFITRLIVFIEKLTAPLADRIVLLTRRSIEEYVRRRIASREKFVAISPGIDISKYRPDPRVRNNFRKENGIGENVFVIGWAGRLTQIKNPEIFLEAAAIVKDMMPNTFYTLLGEGDLSEELKIQSDRLGLTDHLAFLRTEKSVQEFMASIDIFVLTSSNEGLGIVLLEAMASTVPVVATEVGGVPEVLDGGRVGLLARPEDPVSLARCMLSLLQNRQSASELAASGRDRALLYSQEETVGRYIDLYRELLSENTGIPVS